MFFHLFFFHLQSTHGWLGISWDRTISSLRMFGKMGKREKRRRSLMCLSYERPMDSFSGCLCTYVFSVGYTNQRHSMQEYWRLRGKRKTTGFSVYINICSDNLNRKSCDIHKYFGLICRLPWQYIFSVVFPQKKSPHPLAHYTVPKHASKKPRCILGYKTVFKALEMCTGTYTIS